MSRDDPRWDEINGLYVGLDGQPITLREFADLYRDIESRILAEDVLASGRVLRTIWSGLRDPWGSVLPFGSAVCPPRGTPSGSGQIREVEMYETREDALAGHARWLAELGAAPQLPEGNTPDGRGEPESGT